MGNKYGNKNKPESGINQRIRELGDAIKMYNDIAVVLRDKMRSPILIPFRMDPLLNININLDEPIKVDKDIAVEIFGKDYLEITGIKIQGQVITFFFDGEDGEGTDTYRLFLYDSINTINVWEFYLLSLIANHDVIKQIDMEREEASAFLNKLMEMTGEGNE